MTDQLERDLQQLFAERAAVDVPPIPAALLDGEPPERRSRWLTIGLVAAAVVAAVAIPIGIASRGDDGPGPADPSPTERRDGVGIDLPYLYDGALHVGSTEVPTDATSVVAAGSQVYVGTGSGSEMTWQRLVGDRFEHVAVLDGFANVVVSYDGSLVAALSGDGRTVTVWDPATGDVVDTIGVAEPSGGEYSALFGFDRGGRLLWQDGAALRMRTVAGSEVTADMGGRWFVSLAPDGIVLLDEKERAFLATIADDGTVTQGPAVPKSADGSWDDAGRLAYSDGQRLMVADPASGGDPVPVPGRFAGGVMVQGWSDGQIVVQEWKPSAGSRVFLVDPESGATRDLVTSPDGAEGAIFPAGRGTGIM